MKINDLLHLANGRNPNQGNVGFSIVHDCISLVWKGSIPASFRDYGQADSTVQQFRLGVRSVCNGGAITTEESLIAQAVLTEITE